MYEQKKSGVLWSSQGFFYVFGATNFIAVNLSKWNMQRVP